MTRKYIKWIVAAVALVSLGGVIAYQFTGGKGIFHGYESVEIRVQP